MLSIKLPTDNTLVQRARRGDKGAFGRLFDRHAARVYHLLRRLTSNADTAEDLTQETFIVAYGSLETWRGQGAFSTWLCGIAVKRNAAARRRGSRQPETEPFVDSDEDGAPFLPNDDPFSHYKRREAEAALSEAIASLSDSCREVFVLIRVEGMSYQAVADFLVIPVGTVQSRLDRATKALHRRLAPLIYGADPVVPAHARKEPNHDV